MSGAEGPPALELMADRDGERLDQFLARRLDGASRSQARQLIDEGLVRVDGSLERASYQLRFGELASVYPRRAAPLEQAEAMLRQALAVDSEWAPGYLSLGCVLNRSGRPRQALEALGRARALDPTIDVDYASLWLEDPFPDWPMRDDATIPARICREE